MLGSPQSLCSAPHPARRGIPQPSVDRSFGHRRQAGKRHGQLALVVALIDELAGERIDIVRYDEDPQVMIPNALQPAEVSEVILCRMMGRAIVLVQEDQLSLAIGKRGQKYLSE